MPLSRRSLLTKLGAGATVLAGCVGGDTAGGATETPGAPPDGPVANAPLPDAPDEARYQTIGASAPVVTYFSNPKCPFCAEFAVGSDRVLSLATLVEEYVASGAVQFRHRGVAYTTSGEPFLGPDAPRAVRAGLAVWEIDPDAYWRYHEYLAANQPPESERWATTDRLVAFANGAGVDDTETVRAAVEAEQFGDRLDATTTAFADVDADGTPTVVVDGTPYSPFEPAKLRDALDAL